MVAATMLRRLPTVIELTQEDVDELHAYLDATRAAAAANAAAAAAGVATPTATPTPSTATPSPAAAAAPRSGPSAALRRRAALSAPPVTVTPAAAARLRYLLSRQRLPPTGGVRLGVKTRGCNGLAYVMDYADAPALGDEVVELGATAGGSPAQPPGTAGASATPGGVTTAAEGGGGRLIVDGRCLMHILGTRVDWVDGRLASEFVFENPAAVGTCGCGESFNV